MNVSCTKVLLHDFNREGDNLSVTGGIPERDLAEQRWQNIELKNKEKLMTLNESINRDQRGKRNVKHIYSFKKTNLLKILISCTFELQITITIYPKNYNDYLFIGMLL